MPLNTILSGRRRRRAAGAAIALAGLVATACSDITDPLLEAEDPDLISPELIDSPAGAVALYRGAIFRLGQIVAGNESTWLFGGLLADEYGTSSTFVQNDETDLRRVQTNNTQLTPMYRRINQVRTSAYQALDKYAEWHKDSTLTPAELYFARGFAEMQLAQDFCGAIPLSLGADSLNLQPPSSTVEVFTQAISSYDSALVLVGTQTTARALSIARAARVGKARALLGRGAAGDFAAAGALVTTALVPTNFSYDETFSTTTDDNEIWTQVPSSRRYLVGDSIEGNARNIFVRNNLPFFSARDPRVPASFTISTNAAGRPDTTKSQDGSTLSRTTPLYGRSTTIPIINGIDARLVEAEAALQAGNVAGMIQILNALRSTSQTLGTVTVAANALPPLTAPATRDAQVSLLFREKAFWTFSRGQRLGDLRRLIRQYGRTADNVFPVGPHYRGGTYGTDVNFPVPQEEETNPNFQRSACKQDQA